MSKLGIGKIGKLPLGQGMGGGRGGERFTARRSINSLKLNANLCVHEGGGGV